MTDGDLLERITQMMNTMKAYLVATAYGKVERDTRRSTPGWGRLTRTERHDLVLAAVENGRCSADSEVNLVANVRPSLDAVTEARTILGTITVDAAHSSDRSETVVAIALGLLDEKGLPTDTVSRKLQRSPKLRLGRAIRAQHDAAELMDRLVAAERALRRPAPAESVAPKTLHPAYTQIRSLGALRTSA